MSKTSSASLLDGRILMPAIGGAFRKLDPRSLDELYAAVSRKAGVRQ